MTAKKSDIRELVTCIVVVGLFFGLVAISQAVTPKDPHCSAQADPVACEEAKRKLEKEIFFIATICAAM